jgi:RNA polymerase sigma-B factor
LGLVKAIDGFDLERGIAFSSFAVPTILGELRRYFRDRTLRSTRRGNDDDGGGTLGDTLSADDDQFERAEDRAMLARLARRISPREREVLRLRFVEDLTQAEIGERIGVSQMQVSRIIRHALARLQAGAEPIAA